MCVVFRQSGLLPVRAVRKKSYRHEDTALSSQAQARAMIPIAQRRVCGEEKRDRASRGDDDDRRPTPGSDRGSWHSTECGGGAPWLRACRGRAASSSPAARSLARTSSLPTSSPRRRRFLSLVDAAGGGGRRRRTRVPSAAALVGLRGRAYLVDWDDEVVVVAEVHLWRSVIYSFVVS